MFNNILKPSHFRVHECIVIPDLKKVNDTQITFRANRTDICRVHQYITHSVFLEYTMRYGSY